MLNSQKGIAHILILLAAVGLVAFVLMSQSADFKDQLFGQLYEKPSSHAAGPGLVSLDQLVVRFKGNLSESAQIDILKSYGLEIGATTQESNLVIVKISPDKQSEVMVTLQKDDRILSVNKVIVGESADVSAGELVPPVVEEPVAR